MTRRPKVTKGKSARPSEPEEETRQTAKSAKYVMAIDFGTTFSGGAFGELTDIESKGGHGEDGIHLHENWPGQTEAGARAYCKTQTSVWYMPGSQPGTWDLRGWGWEGYLGYIENAISVGLAMNENGWEGSLGYIENAYRVGLAMNKNGQQCTSDDESLSRVSTRLINNLSQKMRRLCGYFLQDFKLGLAGIPQDLPQGLTLTIVISDYLRRLSTYMLIQLRKAYGSDAKSQQIQYVFTVPAMWTPEMRQKMKDAAEMAGMVPGLLCKEDAAPSLHDLIIVTEPEAAAVQVHRTLQTTGFRNGDRFLVVDVGGGTTDTILHEKIGSTTRRNIRVKEVTASKGVPVGGTHVDQEFFRYLRSKIGCFSPFQKMNPRQTFDINQRWNNIKCSFNDKPKTFLLPLPGKLAKAWKEFDLENDLVAKPDYDDLSIGSADIKCVFDPVVDKILTLVDGQLVPNLTAILVVGGLSESPYLQERMREAFNEKAKKIVFMSNAGSAVLRGAALYGVAKEWIDMVGSRIAARTYGFDTAWPFINYKHREDYMVIDKNKKLCDNIFGILMRKGQEITPNCVRKAIFKPLYRSGKDDNDVIEVNLYVTHAKNPRYVTDKGVKKLTTCYIPVPRRGSSGKTPQFELSVHFGTLIRASVKGKNFSGPKISFESPVRMKWIDQS